MLAEPSTTEPTMDAHTPPSCCQSNENSVGMLPVKTVKEINYKRCCTCGFVCCTFLVSFCFESIRGLVHLWLFRQVATSVIKCFITIILSICHHYKINRSMVETR